MSMNLYCSLNGREIGLWQTPTHITYMCLYGKKFRRGKDVTGKAARRALELYRLWGSSLGVDWQLPKELLDIKSNDKLIMYMI
jgi:hypothetical protein